MMWQTQKDKEAHREAIRNLDRRQKIEYIYTYHKWTILLSVIAVLIIMSALYRHFTKKEIVVYTGLANVSVGTDMEEILTTGFIEDAGYNPKRCEVYPYYALYLSEDATTENHEYAYASQLKVLASVNSRQMDVVLMNREAYDILSNGGYLLDLEKLASGEIPDSITEGMSKQSVSELPDVLSEVLAGMPDMELTENEVVLEDNSIEYDLGEADELTIITEISVNAIDMSAYPLFQQAGFPDTVYAGIIANTPRLEASLKYLSYLMGHE